MRNRLIRVQPISLYRKAGELDAIVVRLALIIWYTRFQLQAFRTSWYLAPGNRM